MIKKQKKTSEERLKELGYCQQLQRTLTTRDNIILTMSSVSPLMAAFLLGLSPLRIAGTATIPGIMIFAVFAICNGLVLAEMGGSYPVSGSLYSFIGITLPPVFGKIAALCILIQSIVVIASIALGIGEYLLLLLTFLPQNRLCLIAVTIIMLLICGLTCTQNLSSGKNKTIALFALQSVILTGYVLMCICHSQRRIGEIVAYPVYWNGHLKKAGMATVFAAVTPLFCVINGYDASIGLSEETLGESREISKAVITAVIGSVLTIAGAMIASIIAAPELEEYLKADSPFLYTAQAMTGSKGAAFINIGILTASCGALLSQITYYSRVLFSTARDGVWTEKINRELAKISQKEQTPYMAVLTITGCAAVIAAAAPMEILVEFVGVLVSFIYMLISIGCIKIRICRKNDYRPFCMPLFPAPAVIAAGFAFSIIAWQPMRTKAILGIIILAGTGLYFYKKEKKKL